MSVATKREIRIHPACLLFPEMTEEEFAGLKADIKANGQLEPCVFYRDELIDGRNRWRACEELGVEPDECELFDREGYDPIDPVAYVLSVNMHRRHLTTAQRAMIGAEAEAMLAVSAKERQRAAGAKSAPGRPAEKEVANLPQVSNGKARDHAAKLVGVSPRMISDAKAIKQTDPALADEVRKGSISVHAAKKKLAPPAPKPIEVEMPLDERLLDLLSSGEWMGRTDLADEFRDHVPKETALAANAVEGEGRWAVLDATLAALLDQDRIEKRISDDEYEFRLRPEPVPLVITEDRTASVVAQRQSVEDEQATVDDLTTRLRATVAEVRAAWPQGRPGDLLALVEDLAGELTDGAAPQPRRRPITPSWDRKKFAARQIQKIDTLLYEVDSRLQMNDSRTAIKRSVTRARQAVHKLLTSKAPA